MQLYKTKNAIEFTLQFVFRLFHSGTQGRQQMPCSLPEMFLDLGPPGEALMVTLSLTPGRPLSFNMDPESGHCTAPEGSGTSGGEGERRSREGKGQRGSRKGNGRKNRKEGGRKR